MRWRWTKANRLLKHRVWQPVHKGHRVVLEGGSIDVNGRGTLLTTEECLLSKTQERNPGFTREDYAEIFRNYLGVRNVLWLNRGIAGDDTHGHVDDLTRFVSPTTVVTVVEEDRTDANYDPLQENLARLKEMTDQDGQTLRVETLPMPQPHLFRRPALAGQLREFLHCQRAGDRPDFQRSQRSRRAEQTCRAFPGAQSRRRRVPRPCSGSWHIALHDATAARRQLRAASVVGGTSP